LVSFKPELYSLVVEQENQEGTNIQPQWAALSEIPASVQELRLLTLNSNDKGNAILGHSKMKKEKNFNPWIPFSNHHDSKPFEVSSNNCFLYFNGLLIFY
jgi:hypothetical protein